MDADILTVKLSETEALTVRLDNGDQTGPFVERYPAVEIFVRVKPEDGDETVRHPTADEWREHRAAVHKALDSIYF